VEFKFYIYFRTRSRKKFYIQLINYWKLEIFFNSNTSHNLRQNISSFQGVRESIGTNKYLGLPSIIWKKKKSIFGFFKDRLSMCIHPWSTEYLSKVDKETLIKLVAQSIPLIV